MNKPQYYRKNIEDSLRQLVTKNNLPGPLKNN